MKKDKNVIAPNTIVGTIAQKELSNPKLTLTALLDRVMF